MATLRPRSLSVSLFTFARVRWVMFIMCAMLMLYYVDFFSLYLLDSHSSTPRFSAFFFARPRVFVIIFLFVFFF